MSKQTILLAVASFAVGGILMTMYLRQSSAPEDTGTPVAQTPPQGIAVGEPNPATTPSGKKMAFSEFIKQGGAYKCTVNQLVEGIETKGVTYIDGKMIRGEYTTNTQGMSVGSTLIVRDGYTYTWTSMAPGMGFKAKVVEGTGDTNAPTSASYSFNAEQIGEYDCQSWSVDASMFALPKDVTWTEM